MEPKDQATTHVQVDLAELLKTYRELYARQKALGKRLADLRSQMTLIVAKAGNYEDTEGYVKFIIPLLPQIKYDTSALEALCNSIPELKQALWPHRTEKDPKAPYIRVK